MIAAQTNCEDPRPTKHWFTMNTAHGRQSCAQFALRVLCVVTGAARVLKSDSPDWGTQSPNSTQLSTSTVRIHSRSKGMRVDDDWSQLFERAISRKASYKVIWPACGRRLANAPSTQSISKRYQTCGAVSHFHLAITFFITLASCPPSPVPRDSSATLA